MTSAKVRRGGIVTDGGGVNGVNGISTDENRCLLFRSSGGGDMEEDIVDSKIGVIGVRGLLFNETVNPYSIIVLYIHTEYPKYI
jgi:hypothetical protein